ncbi:MAG: ATP-dependent helicase HrpB [Candidatus Riflebacteria bacterium]|nr:ATP-dependent helicase HrpB [Candidatus Riflebacteria bacterium]
MKKFNLPIDDCLQELKDALNVGSDVVLTAEPGAGKSTVVPLALKDESFLGKKKILMLQPRRVAAVAVARRMADLDGSAPGKVIGHTVRFSSNVTANTVVEVLTEGILTSRIQKDPFLEDVGLVIFDEFHERSIHADLSLALCREIQQEIRTDLRIMVMSATMETSRLKQFLKTPKEIVGKGFLYPVEVEYRKTSGGRDFIQELGAEIVSIVNNSAKNEKYLVFLPGVGEIMGVSNYLAEKLHTEHEIAHLYGAMRIEDQQRLLGGGKTKQIILATNVAETSLTIDGITTVIDSGYCRRSEYDEENGLDKLVLGRISKASAKQRAGRAGRVMAGRCIRLWSKSEQDYLAEEETGEIFRSDLSTTALELAAWGCKNLHDFGWFEYPGKERIDKAIELLKMLRAVDEQGGITDIGKKMARLPAEARISRMLLWGAENGVLRQAALAAAILSEKDFVNEADKDPDLEYRIELVLNNGAGRSYTVERIKKAAEQFENLIDKRKQVTSDSKKSGGDALRKALLAAFPDRVCMRRSDKGEYTSYAGRGFTMSNEGPLKSAEYILALKADSALRATSGSGKIFLASKIELDWLKEGLGLPCKLAREIYFNDKNKKVSVKERIWYGKLLIEDNESAINMNDAEKAANVFSRAIMNDLKTAFDLNNEENQNFYNRVRLLVKTFGSGEFESIDEKWFEKQLSTVLSGCFSFKELQQYSLGQLYFMGTAHRLRERFERLVPERFEVPSGSKIKIAYGNDLEPVLAVKLQEMFGQNETPAICEGRIKLKVHLLSPAKRPVQITSDLASFWKTGYKQIVGELRGRYPKHPWPDDPQNAVPTAKTKNRIAKE